MTPRLSIGLPVRNGARWVERSVRSLLDQDFTDFALVVSDNGSTDATPEIIGRLAAQDPRIRYVRQPVDRGGAWNFNEVFRQRDPGSEFFKWAAADDVHRPGYLSAVIGLLDQRPEVVLAHSRTVDVPEGEPEHLGEASPAGDDPDVARRFAAYTRRRHAAYQGFGVVRADVMARTALLAPFSDSDLSLLAELALHGRLVDVDDVLFERHVHSSQSTAAHPTRRSRMSWFDPAAADRVWLFPTWLMGRELLRAIDRAPLSSRDRWRCRARLALTWAPDSSLRFANDLVSSIRATATATATARATR